MNRDVLQHLGISVPPAVTLPKESNAASEEKELLLGAISKSGSTTMGLVMFSADTWLKLFSSPFFALLFSESTEEPSLMDNSSGKHDSFLAALSSW